MEQKAEELFEQWVNGNKKDVMRSLSSLSSMRAACVSSLLTQKLMEHDDCVYLQGFTNMMKERLD